MKTFVSPWYSEYRGGVEFDTMSNDGYISTGTHLCAPVRTDKASALIDAQTMLTRIEAEIAEIESDMAPGYRVEIGTDDTELYVIWNPTTSFIVGYDLTAEQAAVVAANAAVIEGEVMNEQQFYQVTWGTAGVPQIGWGRKVFADPSLEARNASEAQRFFAERVGAGVPCQLQTVLGVTIRDSVDAA